MSKRIVILVWMIVILIAALFLAPAYGDDTTQPQTPERFAKARAKILEAVRKAVPSISIAAAEKGRIVWEETFGFADKEKGIKATPDSLYALASISKAFTGTGLMVLAERGFIDLDKPVNDYLGEARLTAYAGDAAQATLRRMLFLEAGMPMHWNIYQTSGTDRPPDRDESIRRYGIIVEEPGKEYVYSNFAYGVLDRVIARVSGKGYAAFMTDEVFRPLGLDRTSVHIAAGLASHAVQNYDAAGRPISPLAYDHDGASAIYASVHDLIRFGMFHLKNRVPGRKPILRDASLNLLHRPSSLITPDMSIGQARMAMGWGVVDLAGEYFVIASGSAPGTLSRLTLIPDRNLAVAVLANSSASDELGLWKIEWETFAAMVPGFPEIPVVPQPKPEAFVPPLELMGQWEGTVKTYQGDIPMTVSVKSGPEVSITLAGRPGASIAMTTALGPLAFRNDWLSGLFFGSIPTDDARRAPHVVYLRLKLRGDTLSGTVSAVAVNQSFALPHWAALKRKSSAGVTRTPDLLIRNQLSSRPN